MAIIGASRPYFAKYRESGNQTYYHDGGVIGALVQFNITLEGNDTGNDFYADNRVKETQANKFSSGTLTMQTDDLRPEISKAILGAKEEKLGVIPGVTDVINEIIYDDDQNTPYLGIGMVQKKQVDNITYYRAVILPKVMFNVPDDAAETEGESINWQTPELTATILRDDTSKHAWKREATFTTEDQAVAYIRFMLNIEASSNANLRNLKIGTLTLTPAFEPSVTAYTLQTTSGGNTVAASAEDGDSSIKIEVNDSEISNGTLAQWMDGENTVKVTVTAPDGETTKIYTVTVTKN